MEKLKLCFRFTVLQLKVSIMSVKKRYDVVHTKKVDNLVSFL